MPDNIKIIDYNAEPVRYCSRCYSLAIKYEDALGFECCTNCGSSDISEASIEEWEEKYVKRYGKKFVTKNEDPRKSYVYQLPFSKLKSIVFNSPQWREVIHELYPRFPGGLSKADSIILLFDYLVKDYKIDELRNIIIKWKL